MLKFSNWNCISVTPYLVLKLGQLWQISPCISKKVSFLQLQTCNCYLAPCSFDLKTVCKYYTSIGLYIYKQRFIWALIPQWRSRYRRYNQHLPKCHMNLVGSYIIANIHPKIFLQVRIFAVKVHAQNQTLDSALCNTVPKWHHKEYGVNLDQSPAEYLLLRSSEVLPPPPLPTLNLRVWCWVWHHVGSP